MPRPRSRHRGTPGPERARERVTRFAPVAGERGVADAARDVRGFAVKQASNCPNPYVTSAAARRPILPTPQGSQEPWASASIESAQRGCSWLPCPLRAPLGYARRSAAFQRRIASGQRGCVFEKTTTWCKLPNTNLDLRPWARTNPSVLQLATGALARLSCLARSGSTTGEAAMMLCGGLDLNGALWHAGAEGSATSGWEELIP